MQASTAGKLARDLAKLGLGAGDTVILHASYRSVRPVEGGPEGVALAVMEAVGPEGLVVMPAFTLELTDPALWREPPRPSVQNRIRAAMDPWTPGTPTPRMGAVADAFRRLPGVVRSTHPVLSFCAWGRGARGVVGGQEIDDPYGPGSPLDAVLARDGWVLLLGVDHRADTVIHRAERDLDTESRWRYRFPIPDACGLAWREGNWHAGCSEGFYKLAPHLADVTLRGRVGRAEAELVRARDVLDRAKELLGADSRALTCGDAACPGCGRRQ
ncbi:MAG TPA: AAC(3) family N-acetyltransferase [Candidatus Thermoplasmatota archaeon]|nr:AAC(3) family N-acetyltransferase [Candidatus Thermoplasmatota archaeon]